MSAPVVISVIKDDNYCIFSKKRIELIITLCSVNNIKFGLDFFSPVTTPDQ